TGHGRGAAELRIRRAGDPAGQFPTRGQRGAVEHPGPARRIIAAGMRRKTAGSGRPPPAVQAYSQPPSRPVSPGRGGEVLAHPGSFAAWHALTQGTHETTIFYLRPVTYAIARASM